MASIISTDKLSVILGTHFTALHDVTIDLTGGQIIGFIGPSGAGKTTLMRTIVGRQRVSGGQAIVLGKPAGSPSVRPRLSYMTQQLSIYGDLTVRENIRYFANMAGLYGAPASSALREVLAAVDMSDKADMLVDNLSGGQQQRVSLAVSLIGQPELMVLDEPTVGLDPVLRVQLWQLFRRLADQGKTIIISSHVMDEAERCDDLVLIREGRLVAHGSPAELCRRTDSSTVEQAFLALAGDRT